MKLNEIRDNKGARHKSKRLGRGIGSGKGKTSGRGVKGQKARSGVAINGFEGGQMSLFMRTPKRGFTSLFRKSYRLINLDTLQEAVELGKIKKDATIDEQMISDLGIAGKGKDPIKLLSRGELKTPLNITVTKASPNAIKAVEKAGGTVTVTFTEVEKVRKMEKKS